MISHFYPLREYVYLWFITPSLLFILGLIYGQKEKRKKENCQKATE